MLPMGTIVTVCMLIGLIFAIDLPGLGSKNKLPLMVKRVAAGITFMAGCWNFFWYGLQHLTEFWGQMALLSGVLMIVTAIYIIRPLSLPSWVSTIKPLVLLALLLCMLKYAHTIYNL